MQEFRKRFRGTEGTLPGIPAWESELLQARGIDTAEKAEQFLHPSLNAMHDPFAMQDMDRAVTLIRMAIQRGERIMVYGDYDVDGISAVTILMETLLEEGANAVFRIPVRHQEGYGLNEQAVREMAESCQMLITVDCGIANANEVHLAKELGMTVIVTDHHEVPTVLPDADAVLNPLLGRYPFRRLCGAGVALKICQAIQGMTGMRKRLDVAALATVCDIVPLIDENRIIVWEGLRRMPETPRPGLRALMTKAGISGSVRADDLGFRLGPRLNAAGRLGDASWGVRLLMTKTDEEAKLVADQLEESNKVRQETERRITQKAMAAFSDQADLRKDRAVILEGENWNSGIIGLVAGKVCERTHHPAVVLSKQGEQTVGSCRSIPGVNIWEMLNCCGDLFIRFGGHEQAAGLTIPTEKIPEFRTRLNETIREHCDNRCFLPVREYDSELPLEQVTLEMIETLDGLEPSGCGNPAPVFLVKDAFLQESRRVGKDRSHLKLTLLDGDTLRNGIGFSLGDMADQPQNRVDVLFRPNRNEFNGRVTPQLQVLAVQPSEIRTAQDSGETDQTFFLACLQEMSLLAAKKTQHPQIPGELRPEHLLKERIERIDASPEGMRTVYKALRGFDGKSITELSMTAETTEEQVLFALTVFEQTNLIRWEREPFLVKLLPFTGRTDLDRSPLMRYVRALER